MHEDVLAEVEVVNQNVLTLVESITPAQAATPHLVEDWSAIELLAHIIAWQQQSIQIITAIRDGQPFTDPSDGVDHFNAEVAVARQQATWAELTADLINTQKTLVELVRSLPDDTADGRKVRSWLKGTTIRHYGSHMADLERAAALPVS